MKNTRLAHYQLSLHNWLNVVYPDDKATRIFNSILFLIIILNIIAVVVETVALQPRYHGYLLFFEQVSMIIFTLEYVARIWVCPRSANYRQPLLGRIRFMLQPISLVDLFAILPFWLNLAGINMSMLRILRIFRLLKFARMVKYSRAYHFIVDAVLSRKDELMISFFLMFMTLLVASSLMYFAEFHAQPNVFSSIPATFWWAIVTFTTVGYGDAYPVTLLGKIMAAFFIIIGISIFALPTSIITAAMMDQMRYHPRDSEETTSQ